jgi:hypothetical protein
MGWILTEQGQRYLKSINIIEKAIIEQLTTCRVGLTDGQIKLIAHESARSSARELVLENVNAY